MFAAKYRSSFVPSIVENDRESIRNESLIIRDDYPGFVSILFWNLSHVPPPHWFRTVGCCLCVSSDGFDGKPRIHLVIQLASLPSRPGQAIGEVPYRLGGFQQ